MKHVAAIAIAMSLSCANPALASEHCRSPMSQWQSREAVTAQMQQLGISTHRLKIDDGCYELRGRDSDGNRIELKLDPATLAVLEMEVHFRPGADPARYLPGCTRRGEHRAGSGARRVLVHPRHATEGRQELGIFSDRPSARAECERGERMTTS